MLSVADKYSKPGLRLPKGIRAAPKMYRKAGFGRRYFANDNDALVPEVWAKYTLAILMSNCIIPGMVFLDFKNEIADFGDTVNTRKPQAFSVYNKTDADQIATQDAKSTNIPVVLNQHPHVSFTIKDGEESLAIEDLVETYLEPAVIAHAEHIDRSLLGMYPNFLGGAIGDTVTPVTGGGQAGVAGGLTTSNYQALLTELGEKMDNNRCPANGRNLIVGAYMKRLILQNQTLVQAYSRGDGGLALKNATMGTIYGFDHFMSQNMGSVPSADIASSAFLINNSGGYAPGDTTLTVDTGSGAIATGSWIKLGGKVYQVQSHTEILGATTQIVIEPPLYDVVANNDSFTVYASAFLVNNVAGYAAGWSKSISIDTGTTFPKVGQFITFPASQKTKPYTIVKVDTGTDPLTSTTNNIYLNRPLDAAVANNDVINLGPPGYYGFAFHRNAVAMVTRPLAQPKSGAGAISGLVNWGGMSMRVVIAYSPKDQGHIVTIDYLWGVKTLDPAYGAVLNA